MRLHQQVTDQIIRELEAGAILWTKPWTTSRANGTSVMPANASTGRNYGRIDIPILWGAAANKGYPTHQRMTFKQALKSKVHLRKGAIGGRFAMSGVVGNQRPAGSISAVLVAG